MRTAANTFAVGDVAERYAELLCERDCTPEEQAGPGAGTCAVCKRAVLHQWTGECMVDARHTPDARRIARQA